MSTREPGDYGNNDVNGGGIDPHAGQNQPYGAYGADTNTTPGQYGAYGADTNTTPGQYGAYGADNNTTPGQYGAYGNAQAPVVRESNGLAVAALVIGIIALLTSIFGIGLLVGVVGLIVSIMAIVKARKIVGPERRMGMSVAGLVLSILGILIPLAFGLFIVAVMGSTGVMDCVSLPSQEAINACVEDALDVQTP